jgi:uncharacterized membrane protein
MRRLSSLKGALVVLALFYPLWVHFAVLTRSPALTSLSLAWLALLALGPALLRGRPAAWLCVAAIALVLVLGPTGAWQWLLLYASSIAADAFVACLFARTLSAAQTPLIEQLVRLLHPREERFDPRVISYTRTLTLAWAVLFAALALIGLVLALLADPNGILLLLGLTPLLTVPQRAWSLFANFLEFVVVVMFFVAEYAYRSRRFPEQPYANLLDFLRRLIAVAPGAFTPREWRTQVRPQA